MLHSGNMRPPLTHVTSGDMRQCWVHFTLLHPGNSVNDGACYQNVTCTNDGAYYQNVTCVNDGACHQNVTCVYNDAYYQDVTCVNDGMLPGCDMRPALTHVTRI